MSPVAPTPQPSPGPDGVPAELLAALTESGGADGPGPALEAAHQIARRTGVARHDLLVVLGSGADAALDDWGAPTASLPLSDLPGIAAPTAPGHVDRLDSYARPLPIAPTGQDGPGHPATTPHTVRVLVAHGRTHLYEGRGPAAVVALVRAAAATGVRAAVLINANGCLRDWEIGDVMTITDHLNLSGASPFSGTVFVDQRVLWDPELTAALSARTQRTGVYAMVRGSEYQTPAESRMLAALGADCVGMSTILEAIALHQLGVRAAGMSVVSDLSFAEEPTDPDEVVRLVAGAHRTLAVGVEAVLAAL
ncbi:purine-nucleoside phosphorylase [Actinomyces ruminicola]|uniref:purine-nucleoside phosphorylase n=1 Tax=Actinomyces ruminicola TaxID=332524 RepID=A0A1H0F3Q8_9ACTO|nr:purine-nucleoside phosphorylase [Actinomyces ruminicola]SDN89297.1 purine-nucleoside phosphorylase [Actinomyces ruminicola]